MRIPVLPREAAAIVRLRRDHNYTINILSQVFGRSTSLIHRILKFNISLGTLSEVDLRKLPAHVKRLSNANQHRLLTFFLERWNAWICGTEEKPP